MVPPKSVNLKIHGGLEPEILAAEDGKLLPSVIMDNSDAILSLLPTRLKDARQAKGLSLEAVAKLSGVSLSMVSQIERGLSFTFF